MSNCWKMLTAYDIKVPNEKSSQFVTMGSYPTRDGNAVCLLIDGEPAFRRICEAIETARHRVWVTITFMWPGVQMPGGRGSPLDVLERAANRGVDVRIIFWRPDAQTKSFEKNAFWGSSEHFELLWERHPQVNIRWDRAEPGYCQHQKSWLIDADTDDSIAFVGGINLNPNSMVSPGHNGEGQNHDAYVELSGPSVTDVQHNFVQRWNEASERRASNGYWGEFGLTDLPFPTKLPKHRGSVSVQMQRTIHRGRYQNRHAPVDGVAFDIAQGERTNLEQYLLAIQSAQRTIYIENQFLDVLEILNALHEALERGVDMVLLMPGVLERSINVEETPERRVIFAALGNYDHFTLAGIAGLGAHGLRKPVYVHSKLMLIDDIWATVGSANLHHYSLFGNAELNLAIYSPEAVRGFRIALFDEHLGVDTSGLDDLAALRLFRRVALENRLRFSRGDHDWQGLAFSFEFEKI
jgi:cardiolipin synthase A/B